MAFSTDDLEALRRDLAQLPPARPKSVSNRDAVGALTSELAAAQRLGYSVDDLAQLLSSKGLRMTAGTLKGYLQQARKKKRPNKKSTTTGNAGAATAGSTSAPATVAGQPAPAPSVVAAARPAPHAAGEARPAEPAVGKGAPAVPPLPAPAARRP